MHARAHLCMYWFEMYIYRHVELLFQAQPHVRIHTDFAGSNLKNLTHTHTHMFT